MIGSCDNCDRQNVPVSSGQFCGCDTTQCFICQGETDPDPYGELEDRREAQMKLAILRSERLMNFYSAERRAGADPLTANSRMHEFAKRLDARSPFEVEQALIAEIMESAS